MRYFLSLVYALLAAGLIYVLNIQLPLGGSKSPRLGMFLSPQTGFWQNAEPVGSALELQVSSPVLEGKAEVYFDENMVPHVYAASDKDAWFVQGYLHARFRLWQMEFQSAAAGGRLSEIMGDTASGTNFLKIDKFFRRLGMVYAAEKMLATMEQDPETKTALDAYTAGVNAYIAQLKPCDYPLEFKLLNYKPEPWTNLKTAIFAKYMAFDLAGFEEDFEHTNARSILTKEQYNMLYPYGVDSLHPILPAEEKLPATTLQVHPPASADSLYFHFADTGTYHEDLKPNPNNGSNNWAVNGSMTASGSPILCSDPHLGMNLPAIWYEMHLSAPGMNVYGVSLPGAPSVLIGFNDSCSFGFTNAERDVRDYYDIKFRDSTRQQYWYDSAWVNTSFRDEIIYIKDKAADTEHIAMTVWGPVMYEPGYEDKLHSGKYYACRWAAHDSSNEIKTFLRLDHARNYDDYVAAISGYQCPGQNMIFASKSGDIAIRQQGKFPALWRGQGDFVMPGWDSSYAWQGFVPDSLNVMIHNPARGFVSSSNQYPYDPRVYPYYLPGSFELYRGWMVNRSLEGKTGLTVDDMERLQNNNYNIQAEEALPIFMHYLQVGQLDQQEQGYVQVLLQWNLYNDAGEEGATLYYMWKKAILQQLYSDELGKTSLPLPKIAESTMIEALAKDSNYVFADNINTAARETLRDVVTSAFKSIIPDAAKAKAGGMLAWGAWKDGGLRHLLKISAFSSLHINAGGGEGIVNAFFRDHGPSWRMVVEMTTATNAYGTYPGGQSGNPGSPYYDNLVNEWARGKYHKLEMPTAEQMRKKLDLTGTIKFTNQ